MNQREPNGRLEPPKPTIGSWSRLTVIGAAIAVLAAACSSQPSGGTYRIATAPVDPQLLTILSGQLDAQANDDGTACFSITFHQNRTAVVWPAGFTAHGNPLAVYDGDGILFATAGQQVKVGGGRVVSSQRRQVLGCASVSQSIIAGPIKRPAQATPDSWWYSDGQISDMQQIVQAYPTVFGGLWGDPMTHVVTIYIAPDADKDTKAAAMVRLATVAPLPFEQNPVFTPWRRGFITGGLSLADLEGPRSKVTTAQPWVTVVGKHLMGWGIDVQLHAVMVGVDLITPTISEAAASQFGGLVILETSEPASAQS